MRKSRPSASVCSVCRNRKVKCDGRPGGCENCERLDFRCSFSSSGEVAEGNHSYSKPVEVPRKRARLACQPCKAQKARCTGHQPSCERCEQRGVECVYLPSKRIWKIPQVAEPSTEVSPILPDVIDVANSTAGSSDKHAIDVRPSTAVENFEIGTMNVDRTTAKQHIDVFFDSVYPSPEFSFIHRVVFLQLWQTGEIDPVLLKATCGVSSRFLSKDDRVGRDRGARWIKEAQMELLSSFEKPSIIRLQALQLVVLHHQAMRNFRNLLFLFSLCTRMAFLLRLNYEDPALPFLAQESRRRLMWSIWVTDTFLAGGIPDFTLCRTSQIHIRLPCEESDFQLDRAVETDYLIQEEPTPVTSSNTGLLAYFMRVMDIRDRILRYTKKIAGTDVNSSSMQRQFHAFEQELEKVRASLPANMISSAKNLSLRAYSHDSLPRFVLLHVWWHQCHCDLFRFLIPGFRESVSGNIMRRIPSELSQYCRRQCVGHALAIAEIFDLLNHMEQGVLLKEGHLAVPAYQCANILSRSIHMQDIPQGLQTQAGITACLEFTKQLANYNVVAAAVQEDIQRLKDYGVPSISQSRQRTPEQDADDCSPASISSSHVPRHKFSKHNVVATAGIEDDGAALGLRDAASSTLSPPSAAPTSRVMQSQHSSQQKDLQGNPAHTYQPLQDFGVTPAQSTPVQQDYSGAQMYPYADSYGRPDMASVDINEVRDWSWELTLPTNDDFNLDFLFDPLWRIHNQWYV